MQFDVFAAGAAVPGAPMSDGEPISELLKEILGVQKAILRLLEAQAANQNHASKWKHLLDRWRQDHPDLPQACRHAATVLERAYGMVVADLVEELGHGEVDALENEFTLQQFLDRYGMRLGQLGTLLNLVTPLAEASSRRESS